MRDDVINIDVLVFNADVVIKAVTSIEEHQPFKRRWIADTGRQGTIEGHDGISGGVLQVIRGIAKHIEDVFELPGTFVDTWNWGAYKMALFTRYHYT